jgi:uncharacterized RDD family membrane protein YckC
VVDLVVLSWVLAFVLVEVLGRFLGGDLLASRAAVPVTRAEVVVGLLGCLLVLEVLPTARGGRTIGKALLGLRVDPHTADGPVGWSRAVVRALVLVVPFAVPYVGWILPVAVLAGALASPDGRGLHDRLAGTVVVDATPGPTSPGRHRFPRGAIAPLPLPDVAKTTLTDLGVPRSVPGAFRVDPRMAVYDETLFCVGTDPAGRSLCIAVPGGEVVAVDERNQLEPRLAATSLPRFVEGLDALAEGGADAARARLRDVDPEVLDDARSWWPEVLAELTP